jgi:hypothetical protein
MLIPQCAAFWYLFVSGQIMRSLPVSACGFLNLMHSRAYWIWEIMKQYFELF